MAELRHVKGLSELTARLRELPGNLKKNHLRKAVAKGAQVVRDESRALFRRNWQERTGRLARNIILKYIAEKSRGERVTYYVLVKKVYARYSNTKANVRKARVGKKFQIEGSSFYWRYLEFGTAYIRGRSFMRKAFETKSQAAIDAMAAQLRLGLEQYARGSKK